MGDQCDSIRSCYYQHQDSACECWPPCSELSWTATLTQSPLSTQRIFSESVMLESLRSWLMQGYKNWPEDPYPTLARRRRVPEQWDRRPKIWDTALAANQ